LTVHPTLRFLLGHPLLRGRPWIGLGRFAWWQLISRVRRDRHRYDWVRGSRLWLRSGWGGLTGNYYAGLHEFEDMAFLLHLLRPDDLFVDVGANMGSYTVLARGACGARTVSYEPIAETYGRLRDNLALNDAADSRSRLANVAVGAQPGTLRMSLDQDAMNHVAPTAAQPDTREVAVVTLDGDLAEPPLLLKVDVEGFESEVLAGAPRLLADPALRAIVIELNGLGARYGFADADVHARLCAAGFAPYAYAPFARRLTPLDRPGPHNTLYLRDLPFIEARLRAAAPVRLLGRTF
jgi:FkbM family methyltransferase